MKRVLIGLSGGVDSSVSAHLLMEQGYEVVGATMRLHPCSDLEATVNDAKRVCEHLKIEHIVLDFSNIFNKYVITNFIDEYEKGHTPNPCIICNEHLKFGAMLDYALNNGFDYVATGHYADVRYNKQINKYMLYASPKIKDQSYFLYRLKQHQLSHILFPLFGVNKDEVRTIARNNKLPVADKKDSQEICFIPDNNYREFLLNNNVKFKPGEFVNESGEVLGKHNGIINYTIGQRKGLGLSFKVPMFVKRIDPINNTVVLGENTELFSDELICKDLSLTYLDELISPIKVKAKIRFRFEGANATITPIDKNSCKVTFDEPQRAITKGQSVVFYDDNIVLGGGFIV